jgi:cytochrome bd-type quinol oxidase subunit 2
LVFAPVLVYGAGVGELINKNLGDVGVGAGFKSETETGGLPALVGQIINIFLSIMGVLFVILMVYGGYTWMTSYGAEQKVTKAKNLIVDAVIGLIIIMAAFAISNFIIGRLVQSTTI